MISFQLLSGEAERVAPRLLGCLLERELNSKKVIGRIVETEAYDQTDAASHSYRGRTPRTDVMFGAAGRTYVYFTYGMHFCLNIVTSPVGHGSAVLIRALEPIEGLEIIKSHRPKITDEHQLTNGPAKLCQALMIGRDFNGHDLSKSPLKLIVRPPLDQKQIVQATCIGISRDTHRLWRFYIKNNLFVSKT